MATPRKPTEKPSRKLTPRKPPDETEPPPKQGPPIEREPPPERCPCVIRVIPFDCTKGTCQFAGETGTEPGGIRYDVRGGDDIHLFLRVQLNDPNGTVEVRRQAPDTAWSTKFNRILVNDPCKLEERCLLAFRVGIGGAPRPQAVAANIAGALAVATGGPPTLVRPYTDRERYVIVIRGDTCVATHDVEAVDCDSIAACYVETNALAKLAFYGPGPAGPETMFMFFTRLAINGGNALANEYYNSAMTGPRSFRDFVWAGLISALLAEEMLAAFMPGPKASRAWTNFFAVVDRPLSVFNPLALRDLFEASKWFGRAHTRDGVARAVAAQAQNPCCAADILAVHTTLVAAQTPLLQAAFGIPGIGLFLAGTRLDPVTKFSRALAQALRHGVANAGFPGCAKLLP